MLRLDLSLGTGGMAPMDDSRRSVMLECPQLKGRRGE